MRINTSDEIKAKVSILYIISLMDGPVTVGHIIDFCSKHDLISPFYLQGFLDSLTKVNMLSYISHNDVYYYNITANGQNTLELFIESLSKNFRKFISEKMVDFRKEYDTKSIFHQHFEKDEFDSFVVSLSAKNGLLNLFDLKITVGNNKLARSINNNWEKNAKKLYTGIMELLINDNNENPENRD